MQFEGFHWLIHYGYEPLFIWFTIVSLKFSCISLQHLESFQAMKTGSGGFFFGVWLLYMSSLYLCVYGT